MSPDVDKEQCNIKMEKIKLVMAEKELLSNSCKALSDELEGKDIFSNNNLSNRSRIDELLIDISQYLGNIAGFCDRTSKRRIEDITRLISLATLENAYLYILKPLLPAIAGIQVNFIREPFRVAQLSILNLFNFEISKK